MADKNDIKTAYQATKAVYERQAKTWHEQRVRVFYEKPWLDRFRAALPRGARLLDLGCGTGDPVAGYFLEQGYALVGADYSAAMIDLAKTLYPEAEWRVEDMRRLGDLGEFDGIYSWDGFFHLSPLEQRAAIPDFASRIRAGGAMLLTVGDREGEVTGVVGGEPVYHASLSAEEYQALFQDCGFSDITFVANDETCEGRSIIFGVGKA